MLQVGDQLSPGRGASRGCRLFVTPPLPSAPHHPTRAASGDLRAASGTAMVDQRKVQEDALDAPLAVQEEINGASLLVSSAYLNPRCQNPSPYSRNPNPLHPNQARGWSTKSSLKPSTPHPTGHRRRHDGGTEEGGGDARRGGRERAHIPRHPLAGRAPGHPSTLNPREIGILLPNNQRQHRTSHLAHPEGCAALRIVLVTFFVAAARHPLAGRAPGQPSTLEREGSLLTAYWSESEMN